MNSLFKILYTIKSRCQIIRLQYEDNSNINFSDDVLSFVEDINNRKSSDLLLKFNYYNNNLFKDKVMAASFIREVLKYYEVLLNKKDGTFKLEEIINIVSILDKSFKKLKYNVNIKLWIDELLLSLMEV